MQCFVIDPEQSGIFDFIQSGTSSEQEINGYKTKMLKRSEGVSSIEGIGIDRVTQLMAKANLDGAIKVTDKEAVEMSFHH